MGYYDELKKQLFGMIEPLVEGKGMELVHLEYSGGKNGHLHLYIDRENGVSLEDCESVNRTVSEMLDGKDPIPNAYTLEVSSPGLDRPLSKPVHYERFAGNKIKLRTKEPINGRKNYSGELKGIKDNQVIIELVDGGPVKIPFNDILKANLSYSWDDK